jgi:transcription antitermination protein NusB
MKTSDDPRHIRRQQLVQDLFKIEFHKQEITDTAKLILEQREFIDEQIKKAAPEFPLDKINRTDLAILRLAVYELLIEKKEPPNVIIDEAIELAKEFSGDTSPSFVNGALGNIVKHAKPTDIQK